MRGEVIEQEGIERKKSQGNSRKREVRKIRGLDGREIPKTGTVSRKRKI